MYPFLLLKTNTFIKPNTPLVLLDKCQNTERESRGERAFDGGVEGEKDLHQENHSGSKKLSYLCTNVKALCLRTFAIYSAAVSLVSEK